MENKPKAKSRSQVVSEIAEETGLTRKQVASVFEAMSGLIKKDLGKKGPGLFNVAGLMKIMVQRKPATKERQGINPFTGEMTTFKAKPARNVVKVRPLKNLKSMV
jgi:nucleoid DNA-binding protein